MNSKKVLPILFITAVAIPYLNSLTNGFVWLDASEILNKKLIISDFGSFVQMLLVDDNNYAGYHRPMYNMMHTLDYAIWGEHALGFHLSSLLIHIANVMLIYRIVCNFTGNKVTALFIALAFGLLPCHTATVSLIHSKADLLACLFMLLPMYWYSKVVRSGSNRLSLWHLILWNTTFLMALLSKEVAVMFPIFLIGLSYLVANKKELLPRPLVIYPSVISLLFIVYRLTNAESAATDQALNLTGRVLTFIPVYVGYILQTLTSFELTTNDAVRVWNYIPTGTYILYTFLFLSLLVVQYYYARKSIYIAAGLLWFNLFLVPVSQIIPILHFRADRFLYLPSVGFLFAIACIVRYYYDKLNLSPYRKLIMYCITGLLVLGSIRIWDRNKDFSSDAVMFQKLIQTHPECREAQGFVGNIYLRQKDYDQALFHISKALEEQPEYYSFVDRKSNSGNLGVIYMNQNKIQEALDVFTQLKSTRKYDPEVLFNIGICHKKLRQYGEAQANLEDYLSYKPYNIDAIFNLGAIGLEVGDKAIVKKYFTLYLELNPTSEYKTDVEAILQSM